MKKFSGVQAAVLCAVSIQELVVGQVGICTPFLALTLLTAFALMLPNQQQLLPRLVTTGLALVSTLWCALVVVVWTRDTALLARGPPPPSDSLVMQLDRQLFPTPCLWGCKDPDTPWIRWIDLPTGCRVGHVVHGSLTFLALAASVASLVVSATELRRRDENNVTGDPAEQLFAACIESGTKV